MDFASMFTGGGSPSLSSGPSESHANAGAISTGGINFGDQGVSNTTLMIGAALVALVFIVGRK
jgi:hypothetical protein